MLINGRVIRKDDLLFAGIVYLAYSVNTGITLSVLFRILDLDVINEAFLMATIVFCGMAAIGHFAKKDLSTVGGVYGTVLSCII